MAKDKQRPNLIDRSRLCIEQPFDGVPITDRPVTVYDTTLRDGEQTPGVAFSPDMKVAIAQALDAAGVHQIEAGFPAVSTNEREAIGRIVDMGLKAEILVLTRLTMEDIDAAVDVGADMALLFIGTSRLHMEHKHRMSEDSVLDSVRMALDHAKERGIRASFTPEDATRTEWAFLQRLFTTAIEHGACRLGFADTVGCATPEATAVLVSRLKAMTDLPISLHMHNDFGLGLANALAGVKAGATAVSTTVAGLGERTGNVPLEQFVCAMRYLYGVDIGVDTTRLTEVARLVERYSGRPVPDNQPIVGRGAFAHESGIHIAAVRREPATYEAIRPEDVGNERHFLLGKHTGRHAVEALLAARGLHLGEVEVGKLVTLVKAAGERNGRVREEDFWDMVAGLARL